MTGARRTKTLQSLRTELLLELAFLATAALLLAVASAIAFPGLIESRHAALYLTGLILADVAIFVFFGAYLIRRLVLQPLDHVVASAEAIANGDLARRVPTGSSSELARLATSLNRMTNRLLEEQAQLVRAEKLASVGRLAAGVAHEIGNPLGAISGFTHILRRRAVLENEAKEALAGIERESGRIDRIVRGLLDYARPRRGTPTIIDINACASRSVELLRDQGTLRDVRVELTLDPDVPPLSGDRHEMDQVLVNLLLNAADAMRGKGGGGGVVRVITRAAYLESLLDSSDRRSTDPSDFSLEREGSARVRSWLARLGSPSRALMVMVADNGPGVPPSEVERIFDPFYTTKEPGKGTGLGLAISARVVESLGGVIWARQAREGGAAFVMLFPVMESGMQTEESGRRNAERGMRNEESGMRNSEEKPASPSSAFRLPPSALPR